MSDNLPLAQAIGGQGAITADHVGVTLKHVEESIGEGVMAFFLQGVSGVSERMNPSASTDIASRQVNTH